MIRIEGGEGGNHRTEGIEGFGRAFIDSIMGWGDLASVTLGALVGSVIAVMFVGVPAALVSFSTLAIVLPAVLCALAGWMIWREFIRA